MLVAHQIAWGESLRLSRLLGAVVTEHLGAFAEELDEDLDLLGIVTKRDFVPISRRIGDINLFLDILWITST